MSQEILHLSQLVVEDATHCELHLKAFLRERFDLREASQGAEEAAGTTGHSIDSNSSRAATVDQSVSNAPSAPPVVCGRRSMRPIAGGHRRPIVPRRACFCAVLRR